MKKSMLLLTFSILLLYAVPAYSWVITFDDIGVPETPGGYSANLTNAGGFVFSTILPEEIAWMGGLWLFRPPMEPMADNGTVTLYQNHGDYTNDLGFTMTPESGIPFSLQGFDAAELYTSDGTGRAHDINLVGIQVDGTILTSSFSLDLINDGPGGVADFEGFTLPSTWINLTSATFSGDKILFGEGYITGGFLVDNISVNATPVPEPSTWALLGLGLAGIILFGKRETFFKTPTTP